MAFQLSPGVNVSEIDLTNVVPGVSSSIGAFAGEFAWGPAGKRILIDSENTLVSMFGKPNSNNYTSFFTVANFLAYTNNIRVVRSINTATLNATSDVGAGQSVFNEDEYELNSPLGTVANAKIFARYPGDIGNSLTVAMCSSAQGFKSTLKANTTANSKTVTISSSATYLAPGDILTIGSSDYVINTISANNGTTTVVTTSNVTSTSANTGVSITSKWLYNSLFDSAPGESIYATSQGATADELHIVVVDTQGKFSGERGTVLEKFSHVSKAGDAKTDDGSPNFYPTKVFNESKYIYIGNHLASADNWGLSASGISFIKVDNYKIDLTGGTSNPPVDGDISTSYDLFSNPDEVDISLILTGAADLTIANKALTIANQRKDCVAFVSPLRQDAVSSVNLDNIVAFRNSMSPSTSYSIMDSAWKYQFDKYNNTYRYVPMNGDIAGLCARTDNIRDPWWSPAGFNRGQILNAIKLSWNPSKAQRDELYKNNINPVVAFPGEGIVLYGDKTMQAKPSAFDRINVRRLFIVLEKSIAIAAKYSLFEFNDSFTRAQFISMVEPFLRDVKGRRGIYDFKVICDETNNTAEVIDTNRFVGDIYIKPSRSINFIQLNFVAVRTGVDFTEIAGKF